MKLLAFDTSTECCSAALLDGAQLLLKEVMTERAHAELILPMIDELLLQGGVAFEGLDGIAFGRGPGSFTGLRIAAGIAQGLAFATGHRVAPVSSLAAVAERVPAQAGEIILVCNDARMGEVYWGLYERQRDGAVAALAIERVSPPDVVADAASARHVAGNGLLRYQSLRMALAARGLQVHDGLYPRADAVARLGAIEFAAGRAVTAEDALPTYVRDDVATVSTRPVMPLQ